MDFLYTILFLIVVPIVLAAISIYIVKMFNAFGHKKI